LPQDFIGLLTALGAAAEDCKIKDPKAWDELAWPT
jgi:hypothetical protein